MSSASFLFLLFLYFRNFTFGIFSELDENLRELFLRQDEDGVQRAAWGATHRARATPSRDQRWAHGWDPPCSWQVPSAPSDAYKITINLKTSRRTLFSDKSSRRAVISNPSSGGDSETVYGTLRRGDRSWRALHRHVFLRDDL